MKTAQAVLLSLLLAPCFMLELMDRAWNACFRRRPYSPSPKGLSTYKCD